MSQPLRAGPSRLALAGILIAHACVLPTRSPAQIQPEDPLRRATELNAQAVELFRQGRYAEAEPLARRALGIREQALGPEHEDVAQTLHNLARLYINQGRYAEAEPFSRRALAIWEKVLGPEHPFVAAGLRTLAEIYNNQGRYPEAEPLHRRALALREKALGPEHPDVAEILNKLANLCMDQGRYAEAEPLHRRALAVREKALGPAHPAVAQSLHNLARLYIDQGRYAEAEPLARRALAIWEGVLGPEHPEVATGLNNLAGLYYNQGRYAEAEPVHRRALAIREKILGPEHPDVANDLHNLARLYIDQGRYAEAEPLARRALAIWEGVLGPEHPFVAAGLSTLFLLYNSQGRYAEAEPLARRALALNEKVLGPGHPDVATSLNNLALLYHAQGRYAEAEPVQRRAVSVYEKAFGPEHRHVATSLNNLAELYRAQGRYAEAEAVQRRALAIREKALGPGHPEVAVSLNNLASIDDAQGRYAEAKALLLRALSIRERVLGPEHAHVAMNLNNLAVLYDVQGRHTDAEPLYRRALGIVEKALGPGHPNIALTLDNLAFALVRQQRLAAARPLYERARRVRLAVARTNRDLDEEAHWSLVQAGAGSLVVYLRLLATLAQDPKLDPTPGSAAADAFLVAEQLRSGAAQAALARAGARTASGDPRTAALARAVDDLRHRRQATAKQWTEAYAKPLGERDATRVTLLQQTLHQLDRELAGTSGRLYRAFPQYADLAAPEPLALADVQKLLRPGEALVSYAALDDRLLLWLVRPGQDVVYKDIAIKWKDLSALVAGFRASLDQTQNPRLTPDRLSPVDVLGAETLYLLLVAPIQSGLAGVKHLIVVPGEGLLPLPFGALLTRAEGATYRQLAALYTEGRPPGAQELAAYVQLPWLAREYAITVLPSATALHALRRHPRTAAAAADALLGFGDPVLAGAGRERGGRMLAARGVQVPVEALRGLNRLPGTRDELLALAKAMGADPRTSLFLGPQATKPVVRRLNESGRLGRARVLAFATHGLLAGEITGLTEPALVLTPPATPSEEDDGLLSLDDILTLKLTNTEWLILSACNTAAADGSGEGLSGLVRAFFFGGAPSLLVSHWSVDDRATQALMTETFRRYAADPALPHAEALRQGMLAVMANAKGDTAYFAHPFAWAPFFLVGEGGGRGP